jgi:drug/metabolite transporter (DMT)-like permease
VKALYTWSTLIVLVFFSTAGDVLMSRAMKRIGDLGELRRRKGLGTVIQRVVTSGTFLLGLLFMALGFFSLLFALSWGDVSLVVPASASLGLLTNALGAKVFLHEHVDGRRWLAAVLVGAGVALLAS